ncbi:hypothetical protein ES708_34178 [subsurface metagenome]
MKYNLKNPLWKTDPEKAKEGFEKELREKLQEPITPSNIQSYYGLIEEILGED